MSSSLPDLSGFTGSATMYRHGMMRSITYTEGVQHLAEKTGSYWLLDKIAAMQLDPAFKAQSFQVWRIRVNGTKGAIRVEDGNGSNFWSEDLDYTDFPEGQLDVWFTDNTILLPSEY